MVTEKKLKNAKAKMAEARAELNNAKEKRDNAIETGKTRATVTRYSNQVDELSAIYKAKRKKYLALKKEFEEQVSEDEEVVEVEEKQPVEDATVEKKKRIVPRIKLYDVAVIRGDLNRKGEFTTKILESGQPKHPNFVYVKKGITNLEANEIVKQIKECKTIEELDKLVYDIRGTLKKSNKVIVPRRTPVQKALYKMDLMDSDIMQEALYDADKELGYMAKEKANKAAHKSNVKNLKNTINNARESMLDNIQKRSYLLDPDNIDDLIEELEDLRRVVTKYNQQSLSFSEFSQRVKRLMSF